MTFNQAASRKGKCILEWAYSVEMEHLEGEENYFKVHLCNNGQKWQTQKQVKPFLWPRAKIDMFCPPATSPCPTLPAGSEPISQGYCIILELTSVAESFITQICVNSN